MTHQTPGKLRVLIVDDHPVVRAGLRPMSDIDPQIVIVGEAGTSPEALLAARQLRPDVVLLDVRLPGTSGLEICAQLKALSSPPRVLFLTSYADDDLVLAAMEAGGDGYLLKDNDHIQIIAAIRTVCQGGALFDPVAMRSAARGLRRGKEESRLESLSPQERKVLEAVSSGKTDKEVAATLGLTPKTVRNYLDRVFAKLQVSTRTEAARFWLQNVPVVD
jgi:two-component system response regulator DevR